MTYKPWMKPDGTPRYFGVEMELARSTTTGRSLDGEAIKVGLRNARVPRLNRRGPGYYHSTGETWDVKTDASCGWEVASPKMELDADGLCMQLERACLGLAAVSPRVDHTCGLHVHVDVSDFQWQDFQRLLALWARYEPFFFEMTPPSRRGAWGQSYCQPVRANSWRGLARRGPGNYWHNVQQALQATTQTAFQQAIVGLPRGALNVSGYARRGTIEFRLQGGSINYEKIRNWVVILLALVNRAKVRNAPVLPLTINQPRPELGFGTRYVFTVLGLAPSQWAPEVAPLCARVEQWANERRAALAGTDETLTF